MAQISLPLEHDLQGLVDSEIAFEVPDAPPEPPPGIALRMRNIQAELIGRAGGQEEFNKEVGSIIRAAVDYVIDAPTLARYTLGELEPDEKTSIGKRIERLLRVRLKISRGDNLDVSLAGEDVDIKTTMSNKWMFSKSSWGHVNLLIAYDEGKAVFRCGLAYIEASQLGAKNRDSKQTLLSGYYENIIWIAKNEPYPPNFLGGLAPGVLQGIVSRTSGLQRVIALLEQVQGVRIPRHAISSVANQKDPLKRIRANGGSRTPLWGKGILVLTGKELSERAIAKEVLGVDLRIDEVMSVSAEKLAPYPKIFAAYKESHGH